MSANDNEQPVELSEERRNEIAYAVLLDMLRQKSVKLRPAGDFKREVGNIAQRTGIEIPELRAFMKPVTQMLLDEMFEE